MIGRVISGVQLIPTELESAESSLTTAEVRRGLKVSLVEGMAAQVYITLTAGPFLTGFALLLGAGNTTLGLVAALPFLIQPLQLGAAWLIERSGARKPWAVGGSLGRLLWLPALLLPYLPLSATQRLAGLILALLGAHALLALCVNAWIHWMTDLVPAAVRGRYFATRNAVLAAMAMAVNYGAGRWLDHARAAGTEVQGYSTMFSVAVLGGCAASLLLTRQPEPALRPGPRLPLRAALGLPLRQPAFRAFAGGMVLWNVALGVAASFYSAHALSVLHVPFTTLAMLDVIQSAISILTLTWWGRLADRFGQRRIMLICMGGVVLLPWSWVLAGPSSLWILYLNAAVSGVWWPGVALTQSNRMMEQMPREGRGTYLAMFAALTGLGYFAASLLGGALADGLPGPPLAAGAAQHQQLSDALCHRVAAPSGYDCGLAQAAVALADRRRSLRRHYT